MRSGATARSRPAGGPGPPAAPDEGVPRRDPIRRRRLHGLADFLPALEPAPLERQRAQHLPPGLDQIQGGGVLRLADALPARVRQRAQQPVGGAMPVQVVHDGVDPLGLGRPPGLHPLEEVHPAGARPAGVGRRQRLPGRRPEGAEAVALAPPPVVGRLPGAPGGGRPDRVAAREAPGRRRPHRVRANHRPARRQGRVEGAARPLFAAKAGATRSPHQVAWVRPRSPSPISSSPIRLRSIGSPRSAFRYAASRSSVQQANGWPRCRGSVKATATTSPTCPAVYVAGRPARGWSRKPASPAALQRWSQRRTGFSTRPSSRARAGTRRPWRDSQTIRARSTRRAGSARECARRLIVVASSPVRMRAYRAARQHLPSELPPASHELTGWTT